jgi:hypothetical protein
MKNILIVATFFFFAIGNIFGQNDTLITNCQVLVKGNIEQPSRLEYQIVFNDKEVVFYPSNSTDTLKFVLLDTVQIFENFMEKRVTMKTQFEQYVIIFQYYNSEISIVAIKKSDETYLFHIFNPEYVNR